MNILDHNSNQANTTITTLTADFQSGDLITICTDDKKMTVSGLDDNHVYYVTAIDVADDTVTLTNPYWDHGTKTLTLTLAELRTALGGTSRGGVRSAPLKARLMDQERVAGVGNLLADEILWRAGLDPGRRTPLNDQELRVLHRSLRATLRQLGRRGGSHMGELMEQRRVGGRCPKDGAELLVATVGGRTTWWCPVHQV